MTTFALLLSLLFQTAPADPAEENPPAAASTEEEKAPSDEKEVVVIGKRRESDVLDVPAGVTVITREEIIESGASSLREVLERAPGFHVRSTGTGSVGASLDLRGYNNGGGNGQRTLVMVDGRRTNNVTSGTTDWATIPLEDIERIEIVRGPAASLYGDPALAGVVQIFTRKGTEDRKWRVNLAGGKFDTIKTAAEVSGKEKDLSYKFHLSNESTDGFRDNSRYEGYDFTAKLSHELSDEWEVRTLFGLHGDDRELPGTISRADMAALGRYGSTDIGNNSDRLDCYGDLFLTWIPEKPLAHTDEVRLHLAGLRGSGNSLMGGFEINDEYEQSAAYFQHLVRPACAEDWNLVSTFGVDLLYEEANARSTAYSAVFPWPALDTMTDNDYVRRSIGIYEHMEASPVEWLLLSGSLRWDRALLGLDRDVPTGAGGSSYDFTKPFDQISPHAGITLRPFETASAYLSWGRPFKYPTRDELVGFTTAAPQLTPERASSWETGIRLHVPEWGRFHAAYYRMDVKDEIFYDSSTWTNLNFDRVRHQGVESEIRITPLPAACPVDLDLFASYTFTRAVIRSGNLDGSFYPVTPLHMGHAGGTVKMDDISCTLVSRLTGRRYLLNDVTNTNETLPSCWLTDLHLQYQWDNVRLFATVNNLFDREIYYYGAVGGAGNEFAPNPGTHYLAGLEAVF